MDELNVLRKIKSWTLTQILRFQHLTWRVCIENREHLESLYAKNGRFLLCFWHGKYIPIFSILEGYEACVITNLSKRGGIIAEISRNFGYQSLQIPEQARTASFRLMAKALAKAPGGAIAVDGPLGPRHQVKHDIIRVASVLGLNLLPASVGSRRKKVFYKRWDRLEIPLLFTKVCLVIGEPIQIPKKLDSGQISKWADRLSEKIIQIDKEAENLAYKEEHKKNVREI